MALVTELDKAIAEVDRGFAITPFEEFPTLAKAASVDARVWVKNDSGNVSGSHKSRHLFGVALALAVEEANGGELAIASCGNAAIAASVIAKAVQRPLRVFIPTWADTAIRSRLADNGAIVEVAPRVEGEIGDPTYLRFVDAVTAGSVPFSVQSTVTPSTIDGGRTMGWELADQMRDAGISGTVDVFIQVGGGALASSTWLGVQEGLGSDSAIQPILHAVQTEACAPLPRAWDRLQTLNNDAERIRAVHEDPETYMTVWDPVGMSAASGILDDVTYDWTVIVEGMIESGGWPITVDETAVLAAHEAGRLATGTDVEPTGTAGAAALWSDHRTTGDHAVVLFTGITRR